MFSVAISNARSNKNKIVTLRRFRLEDAAAISELLNDDQVIKYLSDGIVTPYGVDRAERFIRASMDTFPLDCAIEYCGTLVGAINLIEKNDVFRANLEVGYWIGRSYWGRGIAREALRQMTRVAFRESGIERVFANVFVENQASCRILEACGYRQEGVQIGSMSKGGVLYDGAIYAALKREWRIWDRNTEKFHVF